MEVRGFKATFLHTYYMVKIFKYIEVKLMLFQIWFQLIVLHYYQAPPRHCKPAELKPKGVRGGAACVRQRLSNLYSIESFHS